MSTRSKVALAVALIALLVLVGLLVRRPGSGEAAGNLPPGEETTGRRPGEERAGQPQTTPSPPGDSAKPAAPPRFVAAATTAQQPLPPASIRGPMKREDLREGLRAALPGIKTCYEKQLEQEPRLSGRLVVKFLIVPRDGAGRVSEATIVPGQEADAAPELISPLAEQCILKALAEVKFVAPPSAVEVTYPFSFTAGRL
jgi:hypothetical protein